MRDVYKSLVDKPELKRPLDRPVRGLEVAIETDLNEAGLCVGVVFDQEAQNSVKWGIKTLCSVTTKAVFGSVQSYMCSFVCFASKIYMLSKIS
jgi:hypothetical protein